MASIATLLALMVLPTVYPGALLSPAPFFAQPIPSFLGVYAAIDGKRLAMRPLAGSGHVDRARAEAGAGCGDLLSGSSGRAWAIATASPGFGACVPLPDEKQRRH